ncbi:hypothetical protein Hanom_Chr06g00491511 [Helianthus anomalus]
MKYAICFFFFFFVDDGKAGNDSFLFNRWSYDDVQVLVVFWRRIEVHVVCYFGNKLHFLNHSMHVVVIISYHF